MSGAEVSIGTLVIDPQGTVLSAQIAPSQLINGLPPNIEGKTLDQIFVREGGQPLKLLPEEAIDHNGLGCRLYNGDLVRLFVRDTSPPNPKEQILIVVFIQEELLDRNAAAHARLRSTLGAVIAGFAHEVRNPLAAILSLTESVLSNQNLDEESLRALSKVPHLIRRIEDLIKIALSYGRPKAPNPQWHQLRQLIEETIEGIRLSGVSVQDWRLDLLRSTPVFIDTGHASSILTNLLTNASQATHEEENGVSVSVMHSGSIPAGYIAVDISDKGKGVPENIRERIFEPFFTTKARGTGLGLALARDLARMNGGDVVLLESSTEGSTFRFLLRNKSKLTG